MFHVWAMLLMSMRYICRPAGSWGESMMTLRPSGLERGWVSHRLPRCTAGQRLYGRKGLASAGPSFLLLVAFNEEERTIVFCADSCCTRLDTGRRKCMIVVW